MRRLELHKLHYNGTWESPMLPEGVWHVEQRAEKFFCFYNNRLMHSMYEGKKSLADAIKFCEDHYHQLLGEKHDPRLDHRPTK